MLFIIEERTSPARPLDDLDSAIRHAPFDDRPARDPARAQELEQGGSEAESREWKEHRAKHQHARPEHRSVVLAQTVGPALHRDVEPPVDGERRGRKNRKTDDLQRPSLPVCHVLAMLMTATGFDPTLIDGRRRGKSKWVPAVGE